MNKMYQVIIIWSILAIFIISSLLCLFLASVRENKIQEEKRIKERKEKELCDRILANIERSIKERGYKNE